MTAGHVRSASRLGRVITFYSYKGGTGRSMALANAAWTLAANGMRVLVIDWDLEAPGLHRYFRPYLKDATLEASVGLMDFMIAFAEAARGPTEEAATDPRWYEPYTDLRLYAYAVTDASLGQRGGCLDFVPAGREDAGYTVRVNCFNWQHFYNKLGGGIFLEAVKHRLRSEYDYVLIDSRTGVSDTSGICTVQMPDILVTCFTLNEQSIQGASACAASAVEQRRGKDGLSTLRVMPVPTRVDVSEKERVDAARHAARQKFDGFLGWLDDDQLDEYWGGVEVPYIPFYSLEEILGVFDQPRVRSSLVPSIEALVGWISEQRITSLPPLAETVRREQLGRFIRAPIRSSPEGAPTLFLSYAHRDLDSLLQKFIEDLSAEVGALLGIPDHDVTSLYSDVLRTGDNWQEVTDGKLREAAVILALVSPAFLSSEWAREEVRAAVSGEMTIIAVPWIPSIDPVPDELERLLIRLPSGVRGGMRNLVRSQPRVYREILEDLARSIAVAAKTSPGTAAHLPSQEGHADQIVVPIVAERFGVMRAASSNPEQYGLRRRDWAPFGRPIGDVVLDAAAQAGVNVRLMSLHRFRDWVGRRRPCTALVIVDAATAERSEYDAQLREWDASSEGSEQAIVCTTPNERRIIAKRYKEAAHAHREIHIVTSQLELDVALRDALLTLVGASSPSRLKGLLKGLPAAEVEAERLLVSCDLRDAVRFLVRAGYGQYMAETAVSRVAARLGKA